MGGSSVAEAEPALGGAPGKPPAGEGSFGPDLADLELPGMTWHSLDLEIKASLSFS